MGRGGNQFRSACTARDFVVVVSVLFDIVEELLSVLPAAVLEELGLLEAPMLLVSVLLPLCAPLAELLLGEVELLELGEVELLVLGEVELLVLGELLEFVLELEPPEVWAIARPTPPAKATAVARVVRVFFAFMVGTP